MEVALVAEGALVTVEVVAVVVEAEVALVVAEVEVAVASEAEAEEEVVAAEDGVCEAAREVERTFLGTKNEELEVSFSYHNFLV